MRVIQTSVAKLDTYLTANLPSFLFLSQSESCIAFGEARKTLSTVDGISKAWETPLSMASFGPMAKESAKGASMCWQLKAAVTSLAAIKVVFFSPQKSFSKEKYLKLDGLILRGSILTTSNALFCLQSKLINVAKFSLLCKNLKILARELLSQPNRHT